MSRLQHAEELAPQRPMPYRGLLRLLEQPGLPLGTSGAFHMLTRTLDTVTDIEAIYLPGVCATPGYASPTLRVLFVVKKSMSKFNAQWHKAERGNIVQENDQSIGLPDGATEQPNPAFLWKVVMNRESSFAADFWWRSRHGDSIRRQLERWSNDVPGTTGVLSCADVAERPWIAVGG